jgi:cytochrome P450
MTNPDKPIFTLPVPSSRIYIVTDPSLAAAVQRASKALSFTPLVPDVTKRVLGLDSHTVSQIRQNLDPEPGDPRGFLADMHDMVYTYLGPGELLNEFSHDAATELGRQINLYTKGMKQRGSTSETIDLMSWLQHFVTIGTAQFLYGPENPIAKHPELEQAFWDFDRGLGPLLIDIFPSVTAQKPYRGREAIVKVFTEYLNAGHQRTGSKFVQKRIEIAHDYNWNNSTTARSELSFLFAGITNTAITTFWAVLYIFANPDLLHAVRAELQTATPSEYESELTISMEAIRTSSPTLLATIRECMRLNSDNFSTRLVKSDTLLADKYFLSAGSIVQVAGGVIHADKSIWGPDAGVFNHERFLEIEKKDRNVHPAAFRAFGGGKTLCPGRHFALTEIVVFVAMVVAVFDLEGMEEGREIRVPEKEDGVLPVHILEPRKGEEVSVKVKLRGGVRREVMVVA